MLKGKTVLIGVTGGIAAYKSAYLVSALKKQGANVHVIMTAHATEFVAPLTFQTLSGNRCITDMFADDYEYDVRHISLAKAADLIMIAPATANFIAKAANGIADDMLTTVVLAAKCRKFCVPAMNSAGGSSSLRADFWHAETRARAKCLNRRNCSSTFCMSLHAIKTSAGSAS